MYYKGFEFMYPISYPPRLVAYGEKYDMNFSICLTEIMKMTYIKLFGKQGHMIMLETEMKRLIDQYLKYIEEQNEYNQT